MAFWFFTRKLQLCRVCRPKSNKKITCAVCLKQMTPIVRGSVSRKGQAFTFVNENYLPRISPKVPEPVANAD